MPLTIQPNTEMIEVSNNLENSLIQFSTPGYYFAHNMGGLMPSAHAVTVTYPRFDDMAQYAGYTNWRVNVPSEYEAPYPWLSASPNYVSGLGTPATDGDGNLIYTGVYTFNFMNLYAISAGTYYANGAFKILADNPATGETDIVIAERDYPIVAVVGYPTPQLFFVNYFENLNNALLFTYFLGSPGFDPQAVFVYANMDFTIELNDASGLLSYAEEALTGYKKITISFVEPGVAPEPGVLTAELVLTPEGEGAVPVTVPITIFVMEESEEDLAVVPEELEFLAVKGSLPAAPQVLNLLSTSPWSISGSLPPWLSVTPASGQGNSIITVSVQNYDSLSAGVREFDIEIENEDEDITVPVSFDLVNYLTTNLASGGFYFTKDLDYLRFQSAAGNSHLVVTLQIKVFGIKTYEERSYTREYDIPLFDGQGEFHPGTIVHQLLDELQQLGQVIDEFTYNHHKAQYRPAEVQLSYEEISYTDESVLKTGSINKFYMIKGTNPGLTLTRMGLLDTMQQELTRITPNSVISCNFCFGKVPEVSVKKNGVTIEQFNIVAFNSSKPLFSIYRFEDELHPGDVLEVVLKYIPATGSLITRYHAETKSRKFLVLPEGQESTHLFYENAWGMVEAFEFTGRRRLSSGYSHTTAAKFENLYEHNRKIDSRNVQGLIINTGHLLPGDHKVIDAIVKSPNVWCSFNDAAGPYYKVDAVTSKITNADTASPETSFDVEFNILDNADVSIYLQ